MISTETIQLDITRDMYVMKDSPNVMSVGRLVVDDGYDFIRKHENVQAFIISHDGEQRELWTDNFTPI